MIAATERLYYADPFLRQFDAAVIARSQRNRRPSVALDQTAFYPEGGGQPSDRGTLNGVPVEYVAAEDGVIWHEMGGALTDDTVHGEIAWDRRFDHMQQHHGQHLLSAALEDLFSIPTTSFHLSDASVTIDVDAPSVSEAQLQAAVRLANTVVWEDRPIHARFVANEEVAKLPLRKAPAVDGPVRIVSVPEFDHSPCGGTHPYRTGTVGIIQVLRTERRGTQTRIEFACGKRVLTIADANQGVLRTLGKMLTVGTVELPDAVQRLQSAESAAAKDRDAARTALRTAEAEALLATSPRVGELPVVSKVVEGVTPGELQLLAQTVAAQGGLAILATPTDKPTVVVARPVGSTLHCGNVLKDALAAHGGRGGGSGEMARGGVRDAAVLGDVIEAVAGAVVQHAGTS